MPGPECRKAFGTGLFVALRVGSEGGRGPLQGLSRQIATLR